MSQIYVYILTKAGNGPASPQLQTTSKLFNDDLFKISFAEVNNDDNSDEPQSEYIKFLNCLKYHEEKNPNNYMIIAKDTCTSGYTPEEIAAFIKAAKGAKEWDLCYLCEWMDRCDLNTNPIDTGTNSKLVDTYSPNGIQALLISPMGKKRILGLTPLRNGTTFTLFGSLSQTLNGYIKNKALIATRSKPNIINYDSNLAKNNDDYAKTAECATLPGQPVNFQGETKVANPPLVPVVSNNNSMLIWFVIIFLIILIILAVAATKYRR